MESEHYTGFLHNVLRDLYLLLVEFFDHSPSFLYRRFFCYSSRFSRSSSSSSGTLYHQPLCIIDFNLESVYFNLLSFNLISSPFWAMASGTKLKFESTQFNHLLQLMLWITITFAPASIIHTRYNLVAIHLTSNDNNDEGGATRNSLTAQK